MIVREPLDESCLANASFAADKHDAAAAGGGLGQVGSHGLQVRFALQQVHSCRFYDAPVASSTLGVNWVDFI
jgi:hypothetical protein